ncbi:hypothetical protein ACT3QO_11255 [Psychrobacter sp. AOP7-D1-15]|uniref:hypothetical protein n=1 Tax=unclassified Psychrobacter TaxID=196806 RepID=UPI001D02F219|nr:hypothetical protein [Psychrobacter sp. FME61]
MYQLQQLNHKSNVKRWTTQTKPSFALNYIVSAKLAMALGIAAGTVFICVPSAYAQEDSDLTSSQQVNELDTEQQNQNIDLGANQEIPTTTLPHYQR